MGCFFLNRILRKEHEERMQRRRKGKRQRYCCSHNYSDHLDRLTDDILLHILSFMSTRDCVRSSTLGKRWRFLWTRVPNLKFDSGDHKTLTSFSNFFNSFVFVHKGHNINKFRLKHKEDDEGMEGSENKFEMETLIATAIACNVQVIEIHSGFKFVLPQALFTCKTLVDLTLNCLWDDYEDDFVVLMVPMPGTTVYLPALKKLELRDFSYESEESLVHLLSGCPVLEELTIHKWGDNVVCVFVSSPTLSRLDLKMTYGVAHGKAFEVKLDTPALKYLKLRDSLSDDFSTGMLASLTEADVVFSALRGSKSELYHRSILEFVSKLNNVSCLKLTLLLAEVPDSALIDSALTTEFRNLTNLKFFGDLYFVTKFLENSDNLEVLSIDMVGKDEYWMEPKQVPVCLIYHLGRVRFVDFACLETEFNMVEYILRYAKVLKRVEIDVTSCHLMKKTEACERISLFERASEACQLTFLV